MNGAQLIDPRYTVCAGIAPPSAPSSEGMNAVRAAAVVVDGAERKWKRHCTDVGCREGWGGSRKGRPAMTPS